MSEEEIEYLKDFQNRRKRLLTDAEIFGFAQTNSEHCRHKHFNAQYILDDNVCDKSLFDLIKITTKQSNHSILSAYTDNVAFIVGPDIFEFITMYGIFKEHKIKSALCLKAETHNFPTTVYAFPGAATGSGGEIRDRMGGGKGSIPGVGIAGYLTSYARVSNLEWENNISMRTWKYQDPATILIQASNGASDYGNKFGQPLIAGTVTTFEYQYNDILLGWDKVIMLAGGVGHTRIKYIKKDIPKKGDIIILLGGSNYRIGIGGGSVSSINTGEAPQNIEFNAVQRSNPEMQNRANRVIRSLIESKNNPIISVHDHGAGGHFNCLSELVKDTGARFYMDKRFPIGDPSLSPMEILINESQERMAIVVSRNAVDRVFYIARREQCPCYIIGECTDDKRLIFQKDKGKCVVDFDLDFLFKDTPKKIIRADHDDSIECTKEVDIPDDPVEIKLKRVLRLTKIASKEWLTHKVDRSVTGLVAQQQTVGPLQLPLADVAVKALDYSGKEGIAIGIGDKPIPSIVNVEAGVRMAVGEALLNLIWAYLSGYHGLESVALSVNWMWPCGQPGENARLYDGVKAISDLCVELKIPIPTGKDSISMTQKYEDGSVVKSPGTAIVMAVSKCYKAYTITPDIKRVEDSVILYMPFQPIPEIPSKYLGTSALAQTYNQLGGSKDFVPDLRDTKFFKKNFTRFHRIRNLMKIDAGHDVSEGGILTSLCEMAFAGDCGLDITIDPNLLFYEGLGILFQCRELVVQIMGSQLKSCGAFTIAKPNFNLKRIRINDTIDMSLNELRKCWYMTSHDMECLQMNKDVVNERLKNINKSMKQFNISEELSKHLKCLNFHRQNIKAAIIRDKGTNGDREMAYALYHVGFDVKDVTMTDIVEGRENLEDVNFIVFCGGFSNSDVLGSARGWASIFKYNKVARKVLENYYSREDTLSLSVCNGNQLAILLNLIDPKNIFEESNIEMKENKSGIFESRFVSVDIKSSSSILLRGLEGSTLGIWVAHKEGRFHIKDKSKFSLEQIPIVYSNSEYPFNPNGSDYDIAAVCSKDGRHLSLMPHMERSIFLWQLGYYPYFEKKTHKITAWIEIFNNALGWCINKELKK